MKRVLSLLVGAVLTLIYAGINLSPVSAATSSGLSIPPRKNYVMEPGQTRTDKLVVGNLNSKEDLTITLRPVDFTFRDMTGTPNLMLAENAPQTTWSAKPFLVLPKTFTVPAGTRKTVEITVKVPANQGAGSYYSALQYAATGPSGNNLNLSASGITLVFISVPGTVTEKMSLEKLGAYQPKPDGRTGRFLFIATGSAPQSIGYVLKNQGNVAEAPAGSITLTPTFFGKKINIEEANKNANLALIGQTRLFSACIQLEDKVIRLESETTVTTECKKSPNLWPGRYSIDLNLFYGQNGNLSHEIVGKASFWYLPWWFLIPFFILLLILGIFIYRLYRKIQRAVNGTSQKKPRSSRRGFGRRR